MDISEKLQLILPEIMDDNKLKRRHALKELNQLTLEILKNDKEKYPTDIYIKIETAVFTSLSDKSEINRMEACTLLIIFIENNFINEKSLCNLISIMHHRIGKIPLAEESEDVKLELLMALNITIKKSTKLLYYFNDIVDILVLCLQDKCADNLSVSCDCVNSLSVAINKFHLQSASLIKPLIKCLSNQRFKIRCKVLETIGNVLIYGDTTSIETLCEPLGLCVKDIPQVRLCLVKLGHRLAITFPERYSYWAKILPLVLFGLKDTDREIKTYTENCWAEIGAQYEKENEDVEEDIKLYMPKEVFIDDERQYGIGCQILVRKSLSYLTRCIDMSSDDWIIGTRLKSLQLMDALIINGQDSIVQYSNQILPTLCWFADDTEKDICNEALLACNHFAFFVSPKIYLQVLESLFGGKKSTYDVLFSLLSGTPAVLLQAYLIETIQLLQFNKFTYTEDISVPIIRIISLLASTCDVKAVCSDLLLPLLYFYSCQDLDTRFSIETMQTLADKFRFSDVSQLIDNHGEVIINLIEKSTIIWDEFTPQFLVFLSLSQFGAIEGNLDCLGKIWKCIMGRKDCPIVQYKLIESMQNLILRKQKDYITVELQEIIAKFTTEYINKLLPWSPGKTPEALRTAAVAFLLSIMAPSEYSTVLCKVLRTAVTHLPQLVTDESAETRYLTCKFIKHLCQNRNIHLDNKVLLSFAEILIKRLDDKKSPVRLMASETLLVVMSLDTASLDDVVENLVKNVVDSMLIYLDEDDIEIRQNILDTLMKAGELCPQHLLKRLQDDGHKYRNRNLCQQLESELSALKINI